MVPQTILAFVAFLFLVAPGLFFELLRERRRPTLEETAFREASRIAFTSLVFTAGSVGILAIVRSRWPESMPDPGLWLNDSGHYVQEQYRLVARFFLIQLILSLSIAFLTDRLLIRNAKGRIFSGSIWFHVLRVDRPPGTLPWISLELKDKSRVAGFLDYYTPAEKLENREISLKNNAEGKALSLLTAEGNKVPLDDWRRIVIRGDQIVHLKVKYLPAIPRKRESWWQRALPPTVPPST